MVSDSPVRRVSGKGDIGCDLDGFLIIFIKKCSFELFTWQHCAFILQELLKCDIHTGQESKCCWKNSTNRLAQHRVATHIQFVKLQYWRSAIKQGLPVVSCSASPSLTTGVCHQIVLNLLVDVNIPIKFKSQNV